MRRRPQIHGRPSTRRAGHPSTRAQTQFPASFALFGDRDFSLRGKGACNARPDCVQGPVEGQLLHRALQSAIDQVTARFQEAQSEYRVMTANLRGWYKWKG